MNKLISVLLLSSLAYMPACQNTGSVSAQAVSGSQVKETISVAAFEQTLTALPNAQLVDVRTPEEFAGGHLKNAINIDIRGDAFDASLSKLDKSKPVLVYCLSGGRSSTAAGKMKDMGFSQIYNLDGGIMAWKGAGKAIETGVGSSRPAGLSQASLNDLVKQSQYVLVDYNARWCGPCKKMMPILESLAERKRDKMTLLKIDADENQGLLNSKNITSIPYLELYKDGKLVWQHTGFIEETDLLAETSL